MSSLRSRVKTKRKTTNSGPRSWGVTLIKNRGVFLGFVEAPRCQGGRTRRGESLHAERMAAQAADGARAHIAPLPLGGGMGCAQRHHGGFGATN
jgi:hypothetical protein